MRRSGQPLIRSKPMRVVAPLRDLEIDPCNVRGDEEYDPVDREKLLELGENIHKIGMLQPPICRVGPDGRYRVIAGWRRVKALKLYAEKEGLGDVKVEVLFYKDLSDEQAMIMSLFENLYRKLLSPHQAGLAFKRIKEELGMSDREIAEILGMKRETVRDLRRDVEIAEELGVCIVESRGMRGENICGRPALPRKIIREIARARRRVEKTLSQGGRASPNPGSEEGMQACEEPQAPQILPQERVQPQLLTIPEPRITLRYYLRRGGRSLGEELLDAVRSGCIPQHVLKPTWVTAMKTYLLPAARLLPPYDNIHVMVCPNCSKILRDPIMGLPVVCACCGWPSTAEEARPRWLPEEELLEISS